MKTRTLALVLFSLLLVVSIPGCKKDPIPGPEGPVGPAGPDGPQGPIGNANVDTYTYILSNWTEFGTAGTPGQGYFATASVPEITSNIMNTGVVLAYIDNGAGAWFALPYTYIYATWTRQWLYAYKLGSIEFQKQDDDGFTLDPGTQTFKVVIMDGSAKKDNPDIDYTNYIEVAERFNL